MEWSRKSPTRVSKSTRRSKVDPVRVPEVEAKSNSTLPQNMRFLTVFIVPVGQLNPERNCCALLSDEKNLQERGKSFPSVHKSRQEL
jgi:hypothetical protein